MQPGEVADLRREAACEGRKSTTMDKLKNMDKFTTMGKLIGPSEAVFERAQLRQLLQPRNFWREHLFEAWVRGV